ncbi:hypothetical protein ACRRTK_014661 [Alexandromys fortis]
MHRRHRRCRVRPRSRRTDRESGRRSSLPGPAPLVCVPETANASTCPERGSRCLPEAGPSVRPGPSTRGVLWPSSVEAEPGQACGEHAEGRLGPSAFALPSL